MTAHLNITSSVPSSKKEIRVIVLPKVLSVPVFM